MKEKTKLLHTATHTVKNCNAYHSINPPVVHASTTVFKDFAEFTTPPKDKIIYGRHGVEPATTFKRAICDLENAYGTILTSCGAQAVSVALLAILKAGDHVLISDGVYDSTRNFSEQVLKKYAIEVTYFNPLDKGTWEKQIQSKTKAIVFETPHSLTMEMPDIDSIVSVAQKHDLVSVVDNTWGAGYLFKALDAGVDISIQAATKYIIGHADALLGTIAVASKPVFDSIDAQAKAFGVSVAPDDVYLALRGLKTLAVRVKQHEKNAIDVIQFLQNHPLIDEVFCPSLPSTPGHQHWQKHFSGICGLLSFTFKQQYNNQQLGVFVDSLRLFMLGYSWGGFDSLITVQKPFRTATPWQKNSVVRLHIGLEDSRDLIDDLAQSLDKIDAESNL